MKFEIKARWTGKILFEGEFGSWRICIEAALKSRADLTDAVLRGADLTDAVLTDAVLRGADLTRADLTRAVLTDAVLRGADLTDAVLTDADLRGADLTRAVLRGAVLTDAVLTPIRDDIWAVLSSSPKEVPALLEKLKAGEVDGSCYEGKCACLVGTLANARGCDHGEIPGLSPNGARAAERFFMNIKPGDNPDNSQSCKIVVEWVEEWLSNVRALVGSK